MGKVMPRTSEAFDAAAVRGKGEIFECAIKVGKGYESMIESYRRVSDWIEDHRGDRHLHVVSEDLSEEMEWLLGSGFAWRAGYSRFIDYSRYFLAMEERINRLKSLPLYKDDEKRERVQRQWDKWFPAWKEDPENRSLWACGWMLMEWRVAEFAPTFPRKVKVSEKRVEDLIDTIKLLN